MCVQQQHGFAEEDPGREIKRFVSVARVYIA